MKQAGQKLLPKLRHLEVGIALSVLGTMLIPTWLFLGGLGRDWVELDSPRQKGVAVYTSLEAPPLPTGAVCLKADGAGEQSWTRRFLFWLPAEPIVPEKLAKRDFLIEILNLKNRMDGVSGPRYALQNPRNGYQWHWPGENGLQYRLESVQCDDGYYLYSEVSTISQESR